MDRPEDVRAIRQQFDNLRESERTLSRPKLTTVEFELDSDEEPQPKTPAIDFSLLATSLLRNPNRDHVLTNLAAAMSPDGEEELKALVRGLERLIASLGVALRVEVRRPDGRGRYRLRLIEV